jgi:5'-3' exonuclease
LRRLLIDSNNYFLRAWSCVPTLSQNGEHIGGITGYFNGLQKLIRIINPGQITIIWDGGGGSVRRRGLNSEYKHHRRAIHLNRVVTGMEAEREQENKIWQMGQLYEMLSFLPAAQFMVENVEADDVIAYLVNGSVEQSVIVSSDKDFFQLLGTRTIVYRPTQDEVYTPEKCKASFGVLPRNYVAARSVIGAGDKSDGLFGVKGVGWKTLVKLVPFLAEDRDVLPDEIFRFCAGKDGFLGEIYEKRNLILNNYQLMNLSAPLLSFGTCRLIDEEMKIKRVYKKIKLFQKMIALGFDKLDWNVLDKKAKEIVGH